MRTIVCTKTSTNVPDALQYLESTVHPIPEPSGSQLLIKIEYAALNFFDGLILENKYQMKFKPPFVPGTEFSGTVIKMGKKIKGFSVGDRICGQTQTGTLSEYALTTTHSIWKIPDAMSLEQAAAFCVTYGTSFMALVQRAQINKKSTVLVTAASGGVGTACCQIADAVGCKKIIGCVGSPAKMAIARQCGCDLVINYRDDPEWSKMLKKKRIGVDVFADIVGGEAWNQGMKVMNWFGKAIVIGFAGGTIQKIKANRVLLKNIDVVGVAWGATAMKNFQIYRASVSDALKLFETGKLNPIIGGVYDGTSLNDVKKAYLDLMGRKSTGKLLVKMSASSKL